ncbi:Acylamino-acid-releasing enzyme [Thalictrum thalictroides]|uniref:acylaminoacyl-peptidase n=1 Tax=Thalictrum thalictroides TaxID=46969 RepID=A0A7J6W2V5_THATH|nr:Acylamino-acid-releasing enzyme [Thalictrum thalictroides]
MASAHNVITTINIANCCCFRFPPLLSSLPRKSLTLRPFSSRSTNKLPTFLAMGASGVVSAKELPLGLDASTEEEYASQSKLLQEFSSISSVDKAWLFKSDDGNSSRAMFSVSQPNLLSNKKRTYILSSQVLKDSNHSVNFQWAPFPVEMTGVSTIVPSPSGLKMLVVRNQEKGSPTQLEIWGASQLQKEIHVPDSVHGSVYTDGWFEGISWNSDETLIAYIAEEPSPSKPAFDISGYNKGASSEKDYGSWKGQGDWEEDWGETYVGKRQPALFVLNIVSEEVHGIKGISKSLSVGQVVWSPTTNRVHQYLVFVGWSSHCGPHQSARKLGIKYCYNRPCALYAVRTPIFESEADALPTKDEVAEDLDPVVNLTQGISSAYFPRFSPDGGHLVFLSSKSAVDSGAHCATDSLHRMEWPTNGAPHQSTRIVDVVPVVMFAEDGSFPGLYCSSILSKPWLSDGCTMIIPSYWRSTQVILSINVLSGKVSRISTTNSSSSWNVLALDGDHILAVSSSPIDPPQLKYGYPIEEVNASAGWGWIDVSSPISRYPEKILSLLSSLKFSVLKIPVSDASEQNLTKGAKSPYEAIFVSSNSQKNGTCNPLIVVLHGGPHSVSLTNFSKSLAFLSSLGYSLLVVNYRGSLGFGEEALQSLPGKVGSQDVKDVLAAIDCVVQMGIADPSKVAVLGGSHGGFLTTHLIGQAPQRFVAAAARNPVCNLVLMVGTTDIPDWCYVEAYGGEGKTYYTEAPSIEQLHIFHSKSPISHISKVKTPTLFLLGAQDLRVPVSNGLQYARALKERGVEVKVIVFPNDVHGIDRPQSDFESFLNIGVWFKKYL